jgi:hypothetical protein
LHEPSHLELYATGLILAAISVGKLSRFTRTTSICGKFRCHLRMSGNQLDSVNSIRC